MLSFHYDTPLTPCKCQNLKNISSFLLVLSLSNVVISVYISYNHFKGDGGGAIIGVCPGRCRILTCSDFICRDFFAANSDLNIIFGM